MPSGAAESSRTFSTPKAWSEGVFLGTGRRFRGAQARSAVFCPRLRFTRAPCALALVAGGTFWRAPPPSSLPGGYQGHRRTTVRQVKISCGAGSAEQAACQQAAADNSPLGGGDGGRLERLVEHWHPVRARFGNGRSGAGPGMHCQGSVITGGCHTPDSRKGVVLRRLWVGAGLKGYVCVGD